MSNWLGFESDRSINDYIRETCGATAKEYLDAHTLTDSGDLGHEWGQCMLDAGKSALALIQSENDRYDGVVNGGTFLVGVVILILLAKPAWRLIDRLMVNGGAASITTRRRFDSYRNGLRSRIEDKVNEN